MQNSSLVQLSNATTPHARFILIHSKIFSIIGILLIPIVLLCFAMSYYCYRRYLNRKVHHQVKESTLLDVDEEDSSIKHEFIQWSIDYFDVGKPEQTTGLRAPWSKQHCFSRDKTLSHLSGFHRFSRIFSRIDWNGTNFVLLSKHVCKSHANCWQYSDGFPPSFDVWFVLIDIDWMNVKNAFSIPNHLISSPVESLGKNFDRWR